MVVVNRNHPVIIVLHFSHLPDGRRMDNCMLFIQVWVDHAGVFSMFVNTFYVGGMGWDQ